jgi:O-antigen ligase
MNNLKSQNSTFYLAPYILLILYICTGLVTAFGAIDILGPQWVYFGSINLITCFYLFLLSKDHINSLKNLLFSYYFWAYSILMIWAIGSYFYAINSVETIINFPRYFNVYISIFLSFFLISKIKSPFVFISYLISGFLFIELISYYNDYIQFFSNNDYFDPVKVKGVSGNKNITAASIAIKIPFVLYLMNISRSRIIIAISFFLLISCYYALSVIVARAAILSSLICFILYLLFILYYFVIRERNLNSFFKKSSYIIIPYFIAFCINLFVTYTSKKTDLLVDTVAQIEFTEKSSNGRFLYWRDAFDHVSDHPFLGCGLGNWKIASIKYGKRHINGYTVPYHAHNDFIQFFAELGVLGGLLYSSLFLFLFLKLILFFRSKHKFEDKLLSCLLFLSLIAYGIDAGLNFPIARPLMQSSFALIAGSIIFLTITNSDYNFKFSKVGSKGFFAIYLITVIPCLAIHFISYQSLTKQGRLLYEFNNNSFKMSLIDLDQISDEFPNLTETALPIKTMKARYFYLNNQKQKAHKYALLGAKDNPHIYFSENLKGQFFLQEQNIDSAYHYGKLAFENIPRNKPHYDVYMRTLINRRDIEGINSTFEKAKSLFGDDKTIWIIFLQALAQTRSIGDPFAMDQASKAHNLFPENKDVFTLYKVLTYGQDRVNRAVQSSNQANELYNNGSFEEASVKFSEAMDFDPLESAYALNAGLAKFQAKDYKSAINYFNIVIPSKNKENALRGMRFKALSLYSLNQKVEACLLFDKLRKRGNKRMYQQEFTKFCK